MDHLSTQSRSALMARIRSRDTKPEMIVRSLVHRMGYRFRLHRSDLPGTPDIVFPGRMKVILVHGCYWHRHSCQRGRSVPTSNIVFWNEKFCKNTSRDQLVKRKLRKLGWDVLVIWECHTTPSLLLKLECRLAGFLET